ncbi:MAG: alpha/beta hydrolase [Alphaproteobacteria bacterium]
MLRAKLCCATLLVALLWSAAGTATAEERIELPTRPGVAQPVFFTAAETPRRSAVLFIGSEGAFSGSWRNNFLARIADRFVAQGISVAIPGAPSDHAGGMSDGFRAGSEHAADIAAVLVFLQQRAPVPVWLIGTSRGTISAAAVATRLGPPRVAGLVLTSTVWSSLRGATSLEDVRVPTLVVHNHDDGCRESPFSAASDGMAALQRAAVKEFIAVSGGTSRSSPCQALSPHGYYGIEDQVAPPIIAWIQAH